MLLFLCDLLPKCHSEQSEESGRDNGTKRQSVLAGQILRLRLRSAQDDRGGVDAQDARGLPCFHNVILNEVKNLSVGSKGNMSNMGSMGSPLIALYPAYPIYPGSP